MKVTSLFYKCCNSAVVSIEKGQFEDRKREVILRDFKVMSHTNINDRWDVFFNYAYVI